MNLADGQETRLSTYLQQQTGIKPVQPTNRSNIAKKNYVYIWAKYSLESKQNKARSSPRGILHAADFAERARFREKLATYLKAGVVAPEFFQVWFWDETGFSLRVIRRKVLRREASPRRALRKCWTLRGSRQKVRGKRTPRANKRDGWVTLS